jgi:DNA anti-recombination protein RmuC
MEEMKKNMENLGEEHKEAREALEKKIEEANEERERLAQEAKEQAQRFRDAIDEERRKREEGEGGFFESFLAFTGKGLKVVGKGLDSFVHKTAEGVGDLVEDLSGRLAGFATKALPGISGLTLIRK